MFSKFNIFGMNKFTLLGSFGQGNFGDDWILLNASKKWKTFYICSRGVLLDIYHHRSTFFKRIILPGGGVFQDRTSNISFYWYFFMVLFSRDAEAYDMDLTELKSNFKIFLLSLLVKFKFKIFKLRPGTKHSNLEIGLDSVSFLMKESKRQKGSVWCPFPNDDLVPKGIDSIFLSDKRNYFPKYKDFDFFYHDSKNIEKSFLFLSEKKSIVSARYHPLIFAWMNGKKGLGIGPTGGKVHCLCKRAGFPWCEKVEESKAPKKARNLWN